MRWLGKSEVITENHGIIVSVDYEDIITYDLGVFPYVIYKTHRGILSSMVHFNKMPATQCS